MKLFGDTAATTTTTTTSSSQEILVLVWSAIILATSASAFDLDWSDKIFRADHHRQQQPAVTPIRSVQRIRTVQRHARRPVPLESASYDWIRQLIGSRLQDSRRQLDQVEQQSSVATTTTTVMPPTTETVARPTLKSRYMADSTEKDGGAIPEAASNIELDYYDATANQQPETSSSATTTAPPTTTTATAITTTAMVPTFRPVLIKPGQRSEKIKGQKFAQTIRFHHHRWNLLDPLSRYRDAVHQRKMMQYQHHRRATANRELETEVNRIDTSTNNAKNHRSWTFTCPATETAGAAFYADLQSDCRAYYHCSGHRRGERFRFQCPNGTRFNERTLNCDWEDNVDCHQQFDLLRA